MNNIVPFEFEGIPVRVVDQNGDPWWVLADVCRVLDLVNPSEVASRLDDDVKDTLSSTEGGSDRIIVSEGGLYDLLDKSRKPAAKRFRRWKNHEVMPSLRKNGYYAVPGTQQPASVAFVREVWEEQTKLIGVQFATVGQEIKGVKIELAANTAEIVRLHEKVDSLAPRRKDFLKKHQDQYAVTCDTRFDGKCLCGCDRQIMIPMPGALLLVRVPDETVYRIDHLNGRHRVGPKDGLPVHTFCNQQFENNPSLRERLTHRAAIFHEEREKLFPDRTIGRFSA